MSEDKDLFDKVHEAYQREDAKGNFIKDSERPSLGRGTAEDAAKAIEKHQKEINDAADKSDEKSGIPQFRLGSRGRQQGAAETQRPPLA